MPERVVALCLLLFSLLLSAGCTPTETDGGVTTAPEDGYEEVRQAAWGYAQEMGWTGTLNDAVSEKAEVEKVVAPDEYEFIDAGYLGKEVLLVTFEEEGKPVASVTNFLVDAETHKVIGYLEGA